MPDASSLSGPEGILFTLDSLHQFDKLVSNVFEKLACRMTEERGKIAKVQSRIAVASDRVATVAKNNDKAITVLSPAKFPVIVPTPTQSVSAVLLLLPKCSPSVLCAACRDG